MRISHGRHQFSYIGEKQPPFSLRKGVLRNFTKFTRKHLRHSLFLNKVAKHLFYRTPLGNLAFHQRKPHPIQIPTALYILHMSCFVVEMSFSKSSCFKVNCEIYGFHFHKKLDFWSILSFLRIDPKEVVAQRCSVKKVLLKISQRSQENTCATVSFLIKLQAGACNFIKKETLAQVFSREFCEISKKTFLHRTPLGDCFCQKWTQSGHFLQNQGTFFRFSK